MFSNVQFINGYSVIELLKKNNLEHYIPAIRWIQESRVNSDEKIEHDNKIRLKIIEYIKSESKLPAKKEIQGKFKIDLRAYFGKVKPYEKMLELLNNP